MRLSSPWFSGDLAYRLTMASSERSSLEASLLPTSPPGPASITASTPPSPPSSITELLQNRDNGVPSAIKKRLYISHFLSTWNSRVFEFGAVLYLASIYPGTLLPMSVYALSRQVSTILFSPFIGRYIDRANRLKVVRLSIGEYEASAHFILRLGLSPEITSADA